MNRLAGHVNNLANIIADARYDGADITLMISMYDSQILAWMMKFQTSATSKHEKAYELQPIYWETYF